MMKTDKWLDIHYREFYDVPRIFVAALPGGRTLLFDCPFDQQQDDYPADYKVYLLPALSAGQLAGSWAQLTDLALRGLGRIPVAALRFDPTRRKQIEAGILNTLGL